MTVVSQHFCWEMEAITAIHTTDLSGFDLSGTLGRHGKWVRSRAGAWSKKQLEEFTPAAKSAAET